MSLKNLVLVILVTILLTSTFYTSLDVISSFFQKITGYTSIIIQATVESPQDNTAKQETTTLTATVTQPQKEEVPQVTSSGTTSVTIEPRNESKQHVNPTILSQVVNQTESLIDKLDKLRASSRDILGYYSSINDTVNIEKWVNVIVHFNQAIDDLEDIRLYAKTVKDSATKEDVDTIKTMIADAMKVLDNIMRLIRSE